MSIASSSIISYRTDKAVLGAVVPEPLTLGDTVNYEFIRMPGFDRLRRLHRDRTGDPGQFKDKDGNKTLAMYLDDKSPIAGGRELWGFPKKYAHPKICDDHETLVCTLHYGRVLFATGTMGYKHRSSTTRRCSRAWPSPPS